MSLFQEACFILFSLICNVEVFSFSLEFVVSLHGIIMFSEAEGSPIPPYAWSMFEAFSDEMKARYQRDSLWINEQELDREELSEIKAAFLDDGMLFDHLEIDKSKINAVEQCTWTIEGDEYSKCKDLAASESIESPVFEFHASQQYAVFFHFKFYNKISEERPHRGIFVEIDEIPENVKRLRIEVDIKCNVKGQYRQLMREQILTPTKRVCGIRVFEDARKLDKIKSLNLVFGVKIFRIDTENELEDENQTEIDSMMSSLQEFR